MKIKLFMLVGLFVIGFAMSATAGAVADGDSDGVPDAFDNCLVAPNGPAAGGCSAQENSDGDAFGDACDADFNNDGFVTGLDFTPFFAAFVAGVPTPGNSEDANCDGFVTGLDFTPWFAQFTAGVPGP